MSILENARRRMAAAGYTFPGQDPYGHYGGGVGGQYGPGFTTISNTQSPGVARQHPLRTGPAPVVGGDGGNGATPWYDPENPATGGDLTPDYTNGFTGAFINPLTGQQTRGRQSPLSLFLSPGRAIAGIGGQVARGNFPVSTTTYGNVPGSPTRQGIFEQFALGPRETSGYGGYHAVGDSVDVGAIQDHGTPGTFTSRGDGIIQTGLIDTPLGQVFVSPVESQAANSEPVNAHDPEAITYGGIDFGADGDLAVQVKNYVDSVGASPRQAYQEITGRDPGAGDGYTVSQHGTRVSVPDGATATHNNDGSVSVDVDGDGNADRTHNPPGGGVTFHDQDDSRPGTQINQNYGSSDDDTPTGGGTTFSGGTIHEDDDYGIGDAGEFSTPTPDTGGDDGGGGGGRWCCSVMVHEGLWTEKRQFARMTAWSLKKFGPKHDWWLAGYNTWGKVVAKHIVKKTSWGKTLMQSFYDYHVEGKKYDWKTLAAQVIIFPGAYIAAKLGAKMPTRFRLAKEEEI